MRELRNKGSGHARVGETTGPAQREGTARLVRHARWGGVGGGGVGGREGVPTYYRPLNSVFRDVRASLLTLLPSILLCFFFVLL